MKHILQQTDDDIDLVRLYPNGSFKAITVQEQREEEMRGHQVSRRKRKRKEGTDSASTKQMAPALRAKPGQTTATTETQSVDDGNNSAPEDDNGQNIINPIILD